MPFHILSQWPGEVWDEWQNPSVKPRSLSCPGASCGVTISPPLRTILNIFKAISFLKSYCLFLTAQSLGCCVWALSSCGEQGLLSPAVMLGLLLLQSTDTRVRGLDSVARGLSCPEVGGIFPDQGSNPCPLHWQVDCQPLDHQGSPSEVISDKTWFLL